MPMIKVTASVPVKDKPFLAQALSEGIAEITGKNESYIQVVIEEGSFIRFGKDSSLPSAFAEMRGIGSYAPGQTQKLSNLICNLVSGACAVPMERIYINFFEFSPNMWGWNGTTF